MPRLLTRRSGKKSAAAIFWLLVFATAQTRYAVGEPAPLTRHSGTGQAVEERLGAEAGLSTQQLEDGPVLCGQRAFCPLLLQPQMLRTFNMTTSSCPAPGE